MITIAFARLKEAAGMVVDVREDGDTLHKTNKESCRARFIDEVTWNSSVTAAGG